MNHVMDIVIKTLNFFHSNSLKLHEFVALLEEIESEYSFIHSIGMCRMW